MEDKSGILGALMRMGEIQPAVADDKYAQKLVNDIIEAMTEKKRQKWPDKELRAIVNKMDSLQRRHFLVTLLEMKQGLDEHYGER